MVDDDFNLPPPPGFRGLHPDLPIHFYERKLPHWRQIGATYFVTFRAADSLPQTHLWALRRWRGLWERHHTQLRDNAACDELVREITRKTERWLDEGYGECVFLNPDLASQMGRSLLHYQDDRCFTSCFTVMPNHVHAVMKPLGQYKLEDILQRIKRFVSRQVNSALDHSGQFWETESYDRIIRDEEHLFRVIQYIGRNPAKAGLPRERWVRWIHSDWSRAGWGFRDVQ